MKAEARRRLLLKATGLGALAFATAALEFLIAPSASSIHGSLPISALMMVQWLALQQVGGSDCGLCALSLLT